MEGSGTASDTKLTHGTQPSDFHIAPKPLYCSELSGADPPRHHGRKSKPVNPVETYLQEVLEIRRSGAGVKETSYYGPLRTLLNEIGATLRPRVRCIVQLQDRGAGLPDAGLFTADQFQRGADAEPLPGQKPARGAIEVKPADADARAIAESEQVARYLREYGSVLVANLRDFLLVGRDLDGAPATLESFSFAGDEAAFWSAATHPRKAADEQGGRLVEFLRRVLLRNAPLTAPEDLA